ncbi:MAG: hypothetical protein OS112_03085 [Methanoregula sp.]|nr:MAG: hypothetical protein OS112_03085 [Methanoregula sp.]
MKRTCRILSASLIFICCISIVSAYVVNNVNIDPSGSLTPGQRVSVSYGVNFPLVSGKTFESANTLDMYTDLANAKWSIIKIETYEGVKPIETPLFNQGGPRAQVDGWLLSYPDRELSIRVTLDGVAPEVDTTQNKAILKINELDSYGKPVSTTGYLKEAMIVNIADINNAISTADSNLQVFRTHIDEKYALEVDTSLAEGKYNDATAAISSARSQPTSQYAAALASLTSAQDLITEGEKALDKAWAEKAIADAQIPITNVDQVINYVKPNMSSTDSRLSPIISKREVAAGYLSNANDEIFAGNYERAREKAQEAYSKGNESYTDALDLKKQISEGFNPLGAVGKLFGSGTLVIIIGVVAVVLIAVGVIIYRKRTRWDELG